MARACHWSFADKKWVQDWQFDTTCSDGTAIHVEKTAEFLLPQPPQDPITLLTGHGHNEVSGDTTCRSRNYDAKFERTGD